MAETLVELIARIKADATQLESGLTDAEKKTEASSKKMADSLKKVGIAMAASGAAITAALGLMGKAAIDEEINIKRLATTINNSGTAYDSVKDSLEAVIAATQRKTGIADNDQRDILGRLVLITQDYNKALELLPTVLDLAAVGEMDASTAATYLGKAFLDLEEGAEEVTVRFGQASLQFKSMEDIQNRVAGAAVNLANPLSILKATMGDVAEVIGSFLIPTIKDLVNRFAAISDGIQNWIKLNPSLVEQIVLSTTKLGLLLLTVGSLILILPKIIGFVTMLTGLMGPWGWAILIVVGAIGYLIAELLGLSKVMSGIKGIMADVEKQMFIMRAEQALSAKEWAKIKEQGYLTEQQFINLAQAMKLSTKELYDQMIASRMLEPVMTTLGDTNIYLATKTKETSNEMDDLETMLNNVAKASKGVTREMEATKQSIARATWQADGYSYSMQLFTQAEIDAAKASGKKVEELKTQADVTIDNTKKIRDYATGIDNTIASINKLANTYTKVSLTPEAHAVYAPFRVGTEEQHNELISISMEINRLMDLGMTTEAKALEPEQSRLAGQVWGYQHGGIISKPTLALMGEQAPAIKEAIIPETDWGNLGGTIINFTQPVFFDREDSMNTFVDMIRKGIQRQDRLRFGGAYSGT